MWALPAARRIAGAVEEFEPLWIEDLIPPDNLEALEELSSVSGFHLEPVLACRVDVVEMIKEQLGVAGDTLNAYLAFQAIQRHIPQSDPNRQHRNHHQP